MQLISSAVIDDPDLVMTNSDLEKYSDKGVFSKINNEVKNLVDEKN